MNDLYVNYLSECVNGNRKADRPVQFTPSPVNPGRHIHSKLPSVLVQTALSLQSSRSREHSSISGRAESILTSMTCVSTLPWQCKCHNEIKYIDTAEYIKISSYGGQLIAYHFHIVRAIECPFQVKILILLLIWASSPETSLGYFKRVIHGILSTNNSGGMLTDETYLSFCTLKKLHTPDTTNYLRKGH